MKIDLLILCDDIRQEAGNKSSLMGIYDDEIQFASIPGQPSWPKGMRLAFYIKFSFNSEEEIKRITSFNLKTRFNETENLLVTGEIPKNNLLKNKRMKIAFIHNNFIFPNKGNLEILLEFYDVNKICIERIPHHELIKISERLN
jgi:hypothetical protein